ncbi:MAG: helix-turn-helix domain-containing protein [Cellulomonadaceae bacterium]|nr:helix-turn-helix domain-containing protein [Cellulomonadaceae bacterium]
MEIGVAEAAKVLGVSDRHVRDLIADHRVVAREVAGRWLIDEASLPSAPRRSRPMSVANAWRLLVDSHELSAKQAYLRRQALGRLAGDAEPERLLASWVVSRARRNTYSARAPEALLEDPAFVLSGLSDPRAKISSGSIVEGYVLESELSRLRRAHLLVPNTSGGSNVVLHVADVLPPRPVPLLLLAADLVEHDGPREVARARELIRDELR